MPGEARTVAGAARRLVRGGKWFRPDHPEWAISIGAQAATTRAFAGEAAALPGMGGSRDVAASGKRRAGLVSLQTNQQAQYLP